jgi:chromosome segregation ATPase
LRHLVSGLAAALTALVLGTLIAGAADAARAADVAKQQQDAQAVLSDTTTIDQTAGDADAYRAQLEQALVRLNAAYADLQARDAAYRELLGTSQTNVERLQASNAQLQQQLAQAAARIQQAEALAAQARAVTTTTVRREHDDD